MQRYDGNDGDEEFDLNEHGHPHEQEHIMPYSEVAAVLSGTELLRAMELDYLEKKLNMALIQNAIGLASSSENGYQTLREKMIDVKIAYTILHGMLKAK